MARGLKLLLMGPPGAGKGTQADLIKNKFNLAHISTGNLLRSAIAAQSALGLEAKGYMDAGSLVPDQLVIQLALETIRGLDQSQGFLLDGFPRTVYQAQELDKMTSLDCVFNLEVEDGALVKRLSGRRTCGGCGAIFHISRLSDPDQCPTCGAALLQREDDREVSILHRLTVYHSQTQPLVEYYAQKGLLCGIPGADDPQSIAQRICAHLEALV